jgi:NAD(P)-dependent dehydrogenase (short-subunit alcohol dehydrogenase family)
LERHRALRLPCRIASWSIRDETFVKQRNIIISDAYLDPHSHHTNFTDHDLSPRHTSRARRQDLHRHRRQLRHVSRSVSSGLEVQFANCNGHRGYYTVAHLAEHGAHVYMCARNLKKGTDAIAEIKKLYPSAQIDLLQVDFMDLASVAAAAQHFLTLETALHGLVNNAGIMATPFEMTKDGHEAQWQTNYLAHWLFTDHLLPVMLKTSKTLPAGTVRIVNLTSSGHLGAPKNGINFEDLTLKDASVWARYGQSKLANILHTHSLHTKHGPSSSSSLNKDGEIWISCVHPGLVGTNLADGVGGSGWGMTSVLSALKMMGMMYPADKGSYSSLFCVASQDMKTEDCGGYFEIFGRCGEPKWLSGPAKDAELAGKLEEHTKEMMRKEGWIQ